MLGGAGYLANYATLSAGIPYVVMANIQSSMDNSDFFFSSLLRFFACDSSFFSHLSYSISKIGLNEGLWGNSPYIFPKTFLCFSNNSSNPSIPNKPHQLCFYIIVSILLNIFLTFAPPPTFEGRPPSSIIIISVLE